MKCKILSKHFNQTNDNCDNKKKNNQQVLGL